MNRRVDLLRGSAFGALEVPVSYAAHTEVGNVAPRGPPRALIIEIKPQELRRALKRAERKVARAAAGLVDPSPIQETAVTETAHAPKRRTRHVAPADVRAFNVSGQRRSYSSRGHREPHSAARTAANAIVFRWPDIKPIRDHHFEVFEQEGSWSWRLLMASKFQVRARLPETVSATYPGSADHASAKQTSGFGRRVDATISVERLLRHLGERHADEGVDYRIIEDADGTFSYQFLKLPPLLLQPHPWDRVDDWGRREGRFAGKPTDTAWTAPASNSRVSDDDVEDPLTKLLRRVAPDGLYAGANTDETVAEVMGLSVDRVKMRRLGVRRHGLKEDFAALVTTLEIAETKAMTLATMAENLADEIEAIKLKVKAYA